MWGKEFLRRRQCSLGERSVNLWETGTPLLSDSFPCPPSSRSVSNPAPHSWSRSGRSMDGTFMMRPSSSSSAAEGASLCSPSSLPRRNATRLYRKWFLKEGRKEGTLDGERGWDTERAICSLHHCRPIKFLGGGRGGMKCQEWRLRMSILDLFSSASHDHEAVIKMEFRGRGPREHYKFLRHLIRLARCPSSMETFLGVRLFETTHMTEVGLAFKLLLVFPSRYVFVRPNERKNIHARARRREQPVLCLPPSALSVCLSPRKLKFSSDSVPVRNLNPRSTICHKIRE